VSGRGCSAWANQSPPSRRSQGECGAGDCTMVQRIAPLLRSTAPSRARCGPTRLPRTGLQLQGLNPASRNTGSRESICPTARSSRSSASSADHRYPKRESASRGRSIAVHGLTGEAIVSASLSAVLLTDADPDADKGVCELQRMRCPATIQAARTRPVLSVSGEAAPAPVQRLCCRQQRDTMGVTAGETAPQFECQANAQRSAAPRRNRPTRAAEGMKHCACRLAAGRTAAAAGPSVGAGRTSIPGPGYGPFSRARRDIRKPDHRIGAGPINFSSGRTAAAASLQVRGDAARTCFTSPAPDEAAAFGAGRTRCPIQFAGRSA
jgi:hypothetical protein